MPVDLDLSTTFLGAIFLIAITWYSVQRSSSAYIRYIKDRKLTLDILPEYCNNILRQPIPSDNKDKVVAERIQKINELTNIIISEPIVPYKVYKFKYKYPFIDNKYAVEMLLSDNRGLALYLRSK